MIKILIAGGTGFIGQGLIRYWREQKKSHHIIVLGRDSQKIKEHFPTQVATLTWDEFNARSREILSEINIIINLCGENISNKRWTPATKQLLFDSRISPTRTLAEACATIGPTAPHLFNASGVGIYGAASPLTKQFPLPVDENTPLSSQPMTFISKLGYAWEHATMPAITAGGRVTRMRFGVVLAKEGGALAKLATSFKYFLGGRIGSGDQPFSWITLHDLCRAIDFMIEHPALVGPVNLVAPHCIPQIELAHSLARVLNRPHYLTLPSILLRLGFGQMADELLLTGQHVIPSRLLQYNFTFDAANIDAALKSLYSHISNNDKQ